MWLSTRGARALAALAVVVGLAAFATWATAQRSPRLYRIGLVAPFEGLYRETGYAALDSLRQQVTALNERLAGRGIQFQVLAVDDGNDPALARRRAVELAADPLVVAVVGHYTPETSAAAAPIYAAASLVQISPVALAATDAGAAAAPTDTAAGLVQVSPVALAATDAGAAAGEAATLSVTAPPEALLQAMQTWAGSDAAAFTADAPLWPLAAAAPSWRPVAAPTDTSATAPANALPAASTDPPASLLADAPLLSLERALVESTDAPRAVALPYSYCPDALINLLPGVSFAIAADPTLDGTIAAATARAASLALRLAEAATTAGAPTRDAIAAAARSLVAAEGWQQHGPAAYAPAAPVAVVPCPAAD